MLRMTQSEPLDRDHAALPPKPVPFDPAALNELAVADAQYRPAVEEMARAVDRVDCARGALLAARRRADPAALNAAEAEYHAAVAQMDRADEHAHHAKS